MCVCEWREKKKEVKEKNNIKHIHFAHLFYSHIAMCVYVDVCTSSTANFSNYN